MLRAPRATASLAALLCGVLIASCGEPPNKEMNQAQGAIDAARAAGAEQYASQEFSAAIEALGHAQEAVAQHDYRLALSHALDSRERAQEAAKQAANQKAVVRSEAERGVSEITTLLAQAGAKLKTAEAARAPRRSLATSRKTVAEADKSVQEARAALARQDYLAARETAGGVADRLKVAIAEIDAALVVRPVRRRR
jgi:hypothetical protein